MSIAFATERRRLAEDELEPIRRSHFPLLQELPREEAQELARWLRAGWAGVCSPWKRARTISPSGSAATSAGTRPGVCRATR